jgi:serine/threonine-protein kinase
MAKVFTITQGLENMGALKTGGQGSVYKGRRIGEIITAIKLLPTPIFSESEDDRNFRDFKNEVQKLRKVNEKPNPNVVRILSSGLSETGNFPFIEMEYIEGPDLEELLKPPHDPVFTIKEVIKVAEQLSNALAHCHSLDVKHGDIKSNNVKFNIHTGNYVLLDFGLAIMSDEQRRTSLRQAGAVEFMAPEQNEGQMFFQTDVYSFGVVLFELLAGRVPFPLYDKGETARNAVRLAHMETLPPDIISLRKEALPLTWPQDRRSREAAIPDWLVTLVYKCLRKKPESRFANGQELHEYIIYRGAGIQDQSDLVHMDLSRSDFQKLLREKEQLQQQVLYYNQQISTKEKELEDLRTIVDNKEENNSSSFTPKNNGVSKASFFAVVLLSIGLAVFSAYHLMKDSETETSRSSGTNTNSPVAKANGAPLKKVSLKKAVPAVKKPVQTDSLNDTLNSSAAKKVVFEKVAAKPKDNTLKDSQQVKPAAREVAPKTRHQYMVTSKAYFYNTPDENTRRNAFVVPSNNAILNALDEQNDFVYVVFTNQLGQSSKGWLRKQDLQLLNE